MTEELDFSIPARDQKTAQSRSMFLAIMMVIVLIAVLVTMGIVLMQMANRAKGLRGAVMSADQQKQLALKLEQQGLNAASAEAWKEYLAAASLGQEDAARIWYRIGKIYQEGNQYDMALSAFYRSESFAKPDDISPEIARRVQECLEAMGKFAALHYELADRVGRSATVDDNSSGGKADRVVAEIGPQKIMKSDLDRRIERLIEQQISRFAAYLPEEQLNKQKEELLKQYSTDSRRMSFLNQYLMEEILYRKARESGLMDDAQVRATLQDTERSILAAKMIEKEFADEIKITSSDLETYFEAHKQEYVQPQRARISHILVRNKQEAADIRKRLKKGEDFAALAEELSQDLLTREKGGEIAEKIEKGQTGDIPGIGNSDMAMKAIFSTPEGQVVKEDVKTDKGIHIIKVLEREKERQKTFDEVKNEVALAFRARKEEEVQKKLVARLKEQYDVVIHQSAFSGQEESEERP